MNPTVPTPSHSDAELKAMLLAALRTLLRMEGKAAPSKGHDPVLDLWQGYPEALATLGFKIALELRKRSVTVSLSFFAMRIPKHDFDIPEWL